MGDGWQREGEWCPFLCVLKLNAKGLSQIRWSTEDFTTHWAKVPSEPSEPHLRETESPLSADRETGWLSPSTLSTPVARHSELSQALCSRL